MVAGRAGETGQVGGYGTVERAGCQGFVVDGDNCEVMVCHDPTFRPSPRTAKSQSARTVRSSAAFMVAFGVLVTALERVRQPPARPVITFTGITGAYLGLAATVEHMRWLYVPCLILLLGSAATQIRASRRSDRTDDERPTGGTA